MATETEHKYLIKHDLWKQIMPDKSVEVKQAYLLIDPNKTIRVRTKGHKGYITIKGKTSGASRPEFEYEIPVADADELINKFPGYLIVKTRHCVKHDGKIWEVDEFKGLNEGLFVAEIELNNEDEKYSLPDWIDKNITADENYANANLALHPFTKWTDNRSKKKILYVDMDSVLVNFQSGIDRLKPEIKSEYDKRGMDEVPGIFSLMDPVAGAIEAYQILSSHFDTYILSTSPWENPTAASDKFTWVKKHLGNHAYKRLILSHHKNLNHGDFLIDDRPNNGADKFRGELILFKSEKFPDWAVVTSYLLSKAK